MHCLSVTGPRAMTQVTEFPAHSTRIRAGSASGYGSGCARCACALRAHSTQPRRELASTYATVGVYVYP